MKSLSNEKPLNVLARYLVNWIRQNSDESAPFESFDARSNKKIVQSTVERWIYNCNYTYYRFGNFIFKELCINQSAPEAQKYIDFLHKHFKGISDNTPLNIISKHDKDILDDCTKDWPPFIENRSRNTLEKLDEALVAFEANPDFPDCHNKLAAFRREIEDEQRFYQSVFGDDCYSGMPVNERYEKLLPLWCLKNVNPLFSLVIWEDEHAIKELATLLKENFEENGYPSNYGGHSHESYVNRVMSAQRSYLDEIDTNENQFEEKSIKQLYNMLESNFFSLDRVCLSSEIPSWLFGKAKLIWNIVVCSVLGPKEVRGNYGTLRTETSEDGSTACIENNLNSSSGDYILRRHYHDNRLETSASIRPTNKNRLWCVIGGAYDKNVTLPASEFREQYNDLKTSNLYIETRVTDGNDEIIEGRGDSRFHAELSIRVKEDGRNVVVARDLNSKNGTYVRRLVNGNTEIYVLKSLRINLDEDAWFERHSGVCGELHFVNELELWRGDFIHLCDSCFELL